MPTVKYLRATDCEHDAAKRQDSYRKDNRNGKRKLMKAYIYTNQFKESSKDRK